MKLEIPEAGVPGVGVPGVGEFVTIVTGLPRSGTSMMMRMLEAGGVPPLTDGVRTADEDNPRGYYELEAVKKTKSDASWLAGAPGKAVKMVSVLLPDLPAAPEGREHRVILMVRDLAEVIASQAAMLARGGARGGGLTEEQLAAAYQRELQRARDLLRSRSDFRSLEVAYRDVLADPLGSAEAVARFLGPDLDPDAMAGVVEPDLYRQRGPAS